MKFRLQAAAAIVGAALSGPADAASLMYSDLVVFGDSLSDVGLAYDLTGGLIPPTPPYYMGQFTGPDGPVWAEIVGNQFAAQGNGVLSYAVGGAQVLETGLTDLDTQIGLFEAQIRVGAVHLGPDPLAVFWIGGNDIFGALPLGTGTSVAREAAQDLVETAFDLTLDPLGIENLLFFTLGDFSSLPAFAGTPFAPAAGLASAAYDQELKSSVADLQLLGLNAMIFDAGALLAEAQTDPASFGFSNTADACIERIDPIVTADCADTGDDPSLYLWYDNVHPGSLAHSILAKEAYAQIAPVPLPASLPLAGVAMLALVALGRRKV